VRGARRALPGGARAASRACRAPPGVAVRADRQCRISAGGVRGGRRIRCGVPLRRRSRLLLAPAAPDRDAAGPHLPPPRAAPPPPTPPPPPPAPPPHPPHHP